MCAWIYWALAYILIGIMLALSVEGMKKRDRLIFIVWPISITLFMLFIIYAIVKGAYITVRDYIKNKRNKR